MVAITGLGVVSPHGGDTQAMFASLMRGESAVREFTAEGWAATNKPAPVAIAPFDVTPWFTPLQRAGVDRVSQLAVAAAQRAWDDAQAQGACDPLRIGIYVGCGMGGGISLESAYASGLVDGRAPPLTVPAFMPNASAAHIAMRLKITGPVLTYAVACASSAIAIGEAAKAIRAGEIDLAIAGGSEALIAPGIVKSWQALQTLATFPPAMAASACRPFALDRTGFALGEGAAFMILESAAHARARGARCYAELAGCGMSCDATHLTKPDVSGQRRAIADALREAQLTPRDIGYCNAHGTATKIGDVVESEALAAVWGNAIDDLCVSSTKSMHGHLIGATGALEAVITVLALQHRQLPPNMNCDEPDPACRINLVRSPGATAPALEAAISSSFAFGGSNAVLAFRRV